MKRSHTYMALVALLGCLLVASSLALAQAREGAHKTSGAFQAGNLYDYEVHNQRNEVVGTIADFAVSPQGRIQYIFLAPSSWGKADRLYVIPWSSLTPQHDQQVFMLNLSQERLKNAPSFARNNWPNVASANWDAPYRQYYGQQMAQEQEGQQRRQGTEQQNTGRTQRQGGEGMMDTAVLFGFGESRLTQQSRTTLDQLVQQLKNKGFETIHLTGHADRIGSDEANFALARRRASQVAAYLAEQGIDPTKIRVLSLGEEVQAAEGRFADERRVEIVVRPSETASAAGKERTATQQTGKQTAGQQGTDGTALLSATVREIDTDNGTITVTTEHGDRVEIQASKALLDRFTEGESVEVRLRKADAASQQWSRAGQTENTSGQQER
ncbi:MAG: OmpA family protein [Candidatus Tectimicrobiota bacterium]